mmetsp:Transcript_32863/g.72590  ORF Transcript_32863/g.72590 Transcript_32863/m.72590 type:complete len:151 (-) Transcript_32863:268-720(-)|eukprot:CAMPEP_0202891724 /NCGR_PEP_ID=MMETSP1392-20130828/1713_1 /ASSEMBLY_ACC=CAM_ASM_000868 /TAXON_ID=225041 /ORGANISM="Chlamydomonas chlamydogama, Strain SAG 11-48b" /LENGTH=150 /DNA_ID=CAMNT_0049575561 /DNA_START=213 /DNA_END=665 /DNA_ORIENTATION=+
MRAVVQRVKSASVEVNGTIVSSIGRGLVCLIGVKDTDEQKDADYICKKILKARAFSSTESRGWDQDVVSINGEVLLVSQFTLYGRFKKPRPDFSKAMPPQQAKEFYQQFVEKVRTEYVPEQVKDGIFGAMMDVQLINDGPVTFIFDSETD